MADAIVTLRSVLDKIAKKLSYENYDAEIKSITSGGANYTSALFLVTLAAPNKPNIELFGKVANINDMMRVLMNAEHLYFVEKYFYVTLVNRFQEIQECCEDADKFVFPEFYGSNPERYKETIVIENLVAKGYNTYSRFKVLDWEHAASSIEALAKFHAISFAFKKKYPEEFEMAVDLFVNKRQNVDGLDDTWKKMIAKALRAVDEDNRGRVVKYLETLGKSGFERFRSAKSKVLIHGDFRVSNMLYKRVNGKIHTIPVDYQLVAGSCPAVDFIYFLFLASDAAFRRDYYDRLVELYYEHLTLAGKNLRLDITEIYPREEFDSDLKEKLPFAVFLGVGLLPVVLVEEDKAPDVSQANSYEHFLVPANDIYEERVRGIIDDCVRWGVI